MELHRRNRLRMLLPRSSASGLIFLSFLTGTGTALAASGQPSDWQLGLQQAATPVMENIHWFHDYLLYWITAITAFVLALLIIVIVRFNARANPIPSRTTHNTFIEVVWTIVPIAVLMAIAVPSFKLLFFQLNI